MGIVWLPSSKKYGPIILEADELHQTATFALCRGFHKPAWVHSFAQMFSILFVNIATEMKVCPVRCQM